MEDGPHSGRMRWPVRHLTELLLQPHRNDLGDGAA
jgi:hypothetical protein